RIALEETAALEVAEALAGRTRLVAHHGARLVQHARAGDPRSPAEVDVLEVREIVVIESTECEQRLPARNHVGSAREEQFRSGRWIVTRCQWIAEAVLKRVTVEGERAADKVDQLSGRIDNFSADGDDVIGSALHRVDER